MAGDVPLHPDLILTRPNGRRVTYSSRALPHMLTARSRARSHPFRYARHACIDRKSCGNPHCGTRKLQRRTTTHQSDVVSGRCSQDEPQHVSDGEVFQLTLSRTRAAGPRSSRPGSTPVHRGGPLLSSRRPQAVAGLLRDRARRRRLPTRAGAVRRRPPAKRRSRPGPARDAHRACPPSGLRPGEVLPDGALPITHVRELRRFLRPHNRRRHGRPGQPRPAPRERDGRKDQEWESSS